MDPFDSRVGAQIRLRRLQLGMSQVKLAEASGISFQQLQKYEKGENRVAASRLALIAETLDVPPACFFAVDPDIAASAHEDARSIRNIIWSRDSLRLIDAFTRIKSPVLKKAVIALVEAMVRDRASNDGDCHQPALEEPSIDD